VTFKPGQSGNPDGRPRGARGKATLALEGLLEGEAEKLTRKAIELALAGDGPALRLCLDRLLPPRKDRPVSFDLPDLKSAKDAAEISNSLLQAVANGDLTPAEGIEISKLIDSFVKAHEAADIEARLDALEKQKAGT
jgi:hypothetical protein